MEKLSEGKEEIYKTKLLYNDQEFELDIDSDYNSFIEKICNLLDISPDSLYLFSMNYNDDDGDNILLSSNEDYKLFFQQVKEKTVNELIIERKDSINDLNKEINNESELNIDINSSNNINNSNIRNPSNNKDINIKKNEEEDIPIEDITYYYRCSSCDIYPIVVVMYYCDKCNMYLCEQCEKNKKKHQHPYIKIENKAQLVNIKEEENQKIEQKRKAKEEAEKKTKEKEEQNKKYLDSINRKKYISSHHTQCRNYTQYNHYPPMIVYPVNNLNEINYSVNHRHSEINHINQLNPFDSPINNYSNNLNLNRYHADLDYNRKTNNIYNNCFYKPLRGHDNYNCNNHYNNNYNYNKHYNNNYNNNYNYNKHYNNNYNNNYNYNKHNNNNYHLNFNY